MHRNDLRRLSRLRIGEARVLLRAGAYQGAYYLAGYAVECALKACIARAFRRNDIPRRQLVNDTHTHDLDRLLDLAGLRRALRQESATQPPLEIHWKAVSAWRESARYNPGVTEQQARGLYFACTARRYGILAWLKNRW